MQTQELPNPNATPNDSGEVLVSREITFRNSTFGALKTFMRDHKRRTGQALSNAAALDMILRAHLARYIHPDPIATMMKLSRPQIVETLQAFSKEAVEVTNKMPTIGVLLRRGTRATSGQSAPSTQSDALS